jgi:hypothetical protein
MEALESMIFVDGSSDGFADFQIHEDPRSKLLIYTRKSKRAPKGAEFLPGLVKNSDSKTLWGFASEKFDKGIGRIAVIGDDTVIALVDRNFVYKVIAVNDLLRIQMVQTSEGLKPIGGRGVKEMIFLKHFTAEAFGLEAKLSGGETAFLTKQREAEGLRKTRQKAEQEELRKKRIAEIMTRPQVYGYQDNGGKTRYGIPVLEDEWRMLKDCDKGVILVDEIDDEGRPVGETAEAFFIKCGKGGHPEKQAHVVINLRAEKKPVRKEDVIGIELPVCEEIFFEVPVEKSVKSGLSVGCHTAIFTTKEGLASLRHLNSGTLIAIEASENKVQVEQMFGQNGSKTLGVFERLS